MVMTKVSKFGEIPSMLATPGKTSFVRQVSSVRDVQFNNGEVKPFASIIGRTLARQNKIWKDKNTTRYDQLEYSIILFTFERLCFRQTFKNHFKIH